MSVKALRNNEVQMIYPQPQLDLVKNIKDLEPTITSKTNFGLSFEHIDFNTTDEQLEEVKVRQAIALALDRQDLVAKTVGQFDNRAQVLNNRYFVNNQPEYEDTSGGQYDKPDVAKAQRCSRALGYQKGADGIYAKGGQRLSFEMMTTAGQPAAGEHDRRHGPAAQGAPASRSRSSSTRTSSRARRSRGAWRAASSRSPSSPG